jgi:hypothetical protein
MEMSGQLHVPVALTLVKLPPVTIEVEGSVGPRASLDAVKKRKKFALAGNRNPVI